MPSLPRSCLPKISPGFFELKDYRTSASNTHLQPPLAAMSQWFTNLRDAEFSYVPDDIDDPVESWNVHRDEAAVAVR